MSRQSQVEIINRNHSTNMEVQNYLKDFRHQLLDLIEQGSPAEAVRFAATRVLESYKNGLKAGREGKPKARYE